MNPEPNLNIQKNRQTRRYSRRENIRRVLWALARPLFRFSPRPMFGWRRFMLRLFGAKIGRKVHIYNSAVVYMPWNLEVGDWAAVGEDAFIYNLGKVTIGERTTISHRAHLCAGSHDYRSPDMPLLKPLIFIGEQAWICTDAFVGPDVIVGEGAVIGARTVVTKDVPSWSIMIGNPAVFLKKRELKVK